MGAAVTTTRTRAAPVGSKRPTSLELEVDVIVSNHNYARYVGDAITSALEQTYPRVSVIVVDDGSTDSSEGVITSFGRDVVAIFKEQGGQASALNAGFDRSSGDVAIFLDADDVLLPDVVERVAAAFSRNPNLAKVHYPMDVIDDQGRRTGVRKPAPHLPLRSGDLRRPALAFPFDVVWMAMTGNGFASWALRRIFPIPEEDFNILADWYLNHLVPLLGPVKALDDVGAYYRIHGSNSYELAEPSLDLEHLRRTIVCAASVRRYVAKLAREERLCAPDHEIVSVSDIANRLISLRMGPTMHPIAEGYGRRIDVRRCASSRTPFRRQVATEGALSVLVHASRDRAEAHPWARCRVLPVSGAARLPQPLPRSVAQTL